MRHLFSFFFILCFCLSLSAQQHWYSPISGDSVYIQGRAWNNETGKNFNRMPDRFKASVPSSVWSLSNNSAGLHLDFITDAKTITVKYTVSQLKAWPNVGTIAKSGIDLYSIDMNGKWMWCSCFGDFNFGKEIGDTIIYKYKNIGAYDKGRGREYRLFLPLYNTVTSLSVGVDDDSFFCWEPTPEEHPIVVYGTSIAQGASASRPALAWTNILQRELDMPVINLGFSGSGKLEASMFDALSEIDAKLFIIDCMPNMTGLVSEIVPRLTSGVKKLRQKTNSPILLVEHDGYNNDVAQPENKNSVSTTNMKLNEAFKQLKADGVENISLMTMKEMGINDDIDSQIDGVHANDIGMRLYANAYMKHIAELIDYKPMKKFMPVRQTRDWATYNWPERHAKVLDLNKKTNPDVIMIGNSITHFWSGDPICIRHDGVKSWERLFKGLQVTNMGYGWDRIENIFWRFYHGELDDVSPKHIFMMAGTNNIGINNEDDIAEGVIALAGFIRKKLPDTKLHIVKIYPRRGQEKLVKAINDKIEKYYVKDSMTDIIDVTNELTLSDGTIDEKLFRDGLHPNDKGYELITKRYKLALDK